MSKKIAVINDLSGFGRCSLVAAISVLSSMGISACPLPTAILTAQTGYDNYYCDDYTDKMDIYTKEWRKLHQSFDGIYTGFLANESQVDKILNFLSVFKKNDTFLVVDPVMGDNGKTHGLFTKGLRNEYISLCKEASVITPNLTELCLLTEYDYQDMIHITDKNTLLSHIASIGKELCYHSNQHVIVTGISLTMSNKTRHIGNLHITKQNVSFFFVPYIGGSYSGTGDLFASCITAALARGIDIDEMIKKAGVFISKALEDSVKEHIPYNDGVNFEKFLSYLT